MPSSSTNMNAAGPNPAQNLGKYKIINHLSDQLDKKTLNFSLSIAFKQAAILSILIAGSLI
jgi:hypothetical protein